MKQYNDFLLSKRLFVPDGGIEVQPEAINPALFGFQRDLTRWALRKGRAAIFADTGLGKTFMQVEFARLTRQQALIIAPLSVARQTVREAAKLGVTVHFTRSGDDLDDRINITNYEMLKEFDPAAFGCVVLDESSILKSLDGKTRQRLTEMFAGTQFKLCCTATPAPNDIVEIGNHAEFLGIMTAVEMQSQFFTHDDNGWRLKKHGVEGFYRWLASWGMSIRKPSDLGYDDNGYNLPPLNVQPVYVEVDYKPDDQLFFTGLDGVGDRIRVRKHTTSERVAKVAELVNASTEQWIVWCGLNTEADEVTELISGAVNVQGSDSIDHKIGTIEAFQDGAIRVLVTKAKIAGMGMNFQNCHNMAFVGLSDSWEAYYQCIRRCYRFGQQYPVNAMIVLADIEDEIYANIIRKEEQARTMAATLIDHVQQFERAEIDGAFVTGWSYRTDDTSGQNWRLLLGDSTERLAELADNSIDLSVFSPPFQSLYTYSPTERDLGNSRNAGQFNEHFGYIVDQLLRVIKPGRNCAVHVADVPAMLVRDGYIGLKDFPGEVIRLFSERGFIYHGRVTIDKNPQVQALRTKSKGLVFRQLEKDSTWSRPALADYVLIFRKPGENLVPVEPDITRQEWILWARAVWYAADYTPGSWIGDGGSSKSGITNGDGISETDTLQGWQSARANDDERHICPLQLGTIERCIRLWTNPGEVVLDPFNGIGSTGDQAIRHGRKYIGIELKPEYYQVAVRNLRKAESEIGAVDLFTWAMQESEMELA